jgi:hypothetical protein
MTKYNALFHVKYPLSQSYVVLRPIYKYTILRYTDVTYPLQYDTDAKFYLRSDVTVLC